MKQSLDTRTKLLTKNPISLMIELSIPAVLGMVVVGLYNMMDSIFVGQMVGAAQMGAVSVSYPFTLINAGSAAMLGVGSASVLSRAIGKKDERTIKKIMGNLVAMVLLLSVIYTIVGMVFTRQLLSLAGASDNILNYAEKYLRIVFAGSLFVNFFQSANMVIRGEGQLKKAMTIIASGAILNIILDPIFITVLKPYGLGIEAAAYRFKVMLITPFMSCSARLPIYILFAEMFFKERAMLVAYSMYLIGLVVAILVAAIIHLIDKKKSENYLLIELPEYKIPSSRTVAIYVWEKVKDYLTKAGTTIFIASILMWIILNFGPHGYTTDMSDSFGAILGHGLVPFFAPIGLGFWQIAVALIAGISAKEVVVSSCAVLFGVSNINSGAGMDTLEGILGSAGFGQLNAFCLMIFCLLYIPCMAALATIRKESGSTRWMLLSAMFQLVVAWIVTFAVYQVGILV